MDPMSKRLLTAAVGLLAFTMACSGDGNALTPTATATFANSPAATATAGPTATPTQQGGGSHTPTPVPQGADSFHLTIKSGPDAGTYTGAYDDGSSICFAGSPAPLNAVYYGDDLSGSGKPINLTLLASPDEPNQVVLQMKVGENGTYNISTVTSPAQGSGTVTVDNQGAVTTMDLTGTTAEGPAIELTVECHLGS